MSLIKKAKKIDKLNTITVPYYVWHLFGDQCKEICINGTDAISFGEDYGSVEELREAIKWYVETLGGTYEFKDEE
jgi:hypothetical protein